MTAAAADKVYSEYANGVRVVRHKPERWPKHRSYAVEVLTLSGKWEDAYHCPWDYLGNARGAAKYLSENRGRLL
jgi:hypothetical protein